MSKLSPVMNQSTQICICQTMQKIDIGVIKKVNPLCPLHKPLTTEERIDNKFKEIFGDVRRIKSPTTDVKVKGFSWDEAVEKGLNPYFERDVPTTKEKKCKCCCHSEDTFYTLKHSCEHCKSPLSHGSAGGNVEYNVKINPEGKINTSSQVPRDEMSPEISEDLREKIKVILVENGLQEKYDFTELLVKDLSNLIATERQKLLESIYIDVVKMIPNTATASHSSMRKLIVAILDYLKLKSSQENQGHKYSEYCGHCQGMGSAAGGSKPGELRQNE